LRIDALPIEVDNSRKLLCFLRIGLADGLHAVAAPRLLFKKGLFVQLPTQSNCPRLQSESDGIKFLLKSFGERVDKKDPDPPYEEETKQREQTSAKGKKTDPHGQSKSLSDLESEMIQNIVRTILEENKPSITQRLHRTIRKCIQTYIADASLLRHACWARPRTGPACMPPPIKKETWVAGKQEEQAGSPLYRQLG
jgi:hypothetical protein